MSFSIATSGLNAVTEQLNNISNNIANAETSGFKSSRTDFSAIYSQGQPSGVGVSNVSQSMTKEGALKFSGRNTDLAIEDNGFFIIRSTTGEITYTRAGNFAFDKDGYLVSGNHRVQGYLVDANSNLQTGRVGDINVGK